MFVCLFACLFFLDLKFFLCVSLSFHSSFHPGFSQVEYFDSHEQRGFRREESKGSGVDLPLFFVEFSLKLRARRGAAGVFVVVRSSTSGSCGANPSRYVVCLFYLPTKNKRMQLRN